MKIFFLLLSLLWLLPHSSLYAEQLVLESQDTQSVLIELYTSEGCSSCPPAERYLNKFTDHQDLWRRFIPLAFHVDYWDYLGWKDRFSKAGYSQRQRHYAQVKNQSTVYTPAFMVNGKNWRPGFYNRDISAADVQAGKLKLIINDRQLQVTYAPRHRAQTDMQLNIALLGMGIESAIEAGENSGKQARHEFVVLSHQQYPSSPTAEWQVPMPINKYQEVTSFALVAWVSLRGNPAPLQSVGGPIPRWLLH